jgi:hypothetical protein
MGLVLWIDQNTFSVSLVERVFKKRGLPFYSLTQVNDFAYLIEDLRPSVVVLDGETFMGHQQRFMEQYQATDHLQSLPFILIGNEIDSTWLKYRLGHIAKPFDPFEIPERLEKILLTN